MGRRKTKVSVYKRKDMKYIVLMLFLAASFNIMGQKSDSFSNATTNSKVTSFEFDKTLVELGKVKKGEKKAFDYTMTNTGTDDIEISYVSYCDCTTVDYPEGKVIKPGETINFDVVFDSTTKDEEETIEIEMELKNIDPINGLPYYLTLDYHFIIVK